MARAKSKAIVEVADGTGGMAQIQDRRFQGGLWPIQFDVPKEEADTWIQYLSAECDKRGWGCASIGQMEPKENSGSITINTAGPGQSQLSVVWERKCGGPIKVKSRSTGTPEFPLDEAREFFEKVNATSAAGDLQQVHCFGHLCYEGFPWRGELWLNEALRLGPPSQQDDKYLIGPRIIQVNSLVKGIDRFHATSVFDLTLRELSVFLTVITGIHVRVAPKSHRRGWTCSVDPSGSAVQCEIRYIGYWEQQPPTEMPTKGQHPPVQLRAIQRPDLSLLGGRTGTETEQELPEDIVGLWRTLDALPSERRRQFLQAGSMWQLALLLGHEYETTRFASMVAACESLKPTDREFRNCNIYDVVEGLLDKSISNSLRQGQLRPQDVRSAHLHAGEFHGSEFVAHLMVPSFKDPTFDGASRELHRIVQAAIIEWLNRRGTFTIPLTKRRKNWSRSVKRHAPWLLAGIAVGILLGGVLARLW